MWKNSIKYKKKSTKINVKGCKVGPCKLIPDYFYSFENPPLRVKMVIEFGILIKEVLWKMKYKEVAMCEASLCIFEKILRLFFVIWKLVFRTYCKLQPNSIATNLFVTTLGYNFFSILEDYKNQCLKDLWKKI